MKLKRNLQEFEILKVSELSWNGSCKLVVV